MFAQHWEMGNKLLQEFIQLIGWGAISRPITEEIEDKPDTELDPALYKKVLERLSQTDQSFKVDIDDL